MTGHGLVVTQGYNSMSDGSLNALSKMSTKHPSPLYQPNPHFPNPPPAPTALDALGKKAWTRRYTTSNLHWDQAPASPHDECSCTKFNSAMSTKATSGDHKIMKRDGKIHAGSTLLAQHHNSDGIFIRLFPLHFSQRYPRKDNATSRPWQPHDEEPALTAGS